MRIGLFGSSMMALTLMLAGCEVQTNSQPAGGNTADAAEAIQTGWTATTEKQLRDAVAQRGVHGLDLTPFSVDAAAGDQAGLTRDALRYAAALARGATDPSKLYDVYTVKRPNPDLKQGLAAALRAGDLEKWLAGLAPQDANYRRLSEAYVALRKQAKTEPASGAAPVIPESDKPMEPGATDPRVPLIAGQLVASDYLAPADAKGDVYTPAMVKAVRAMQVDYGVRPDGMIGADSLTILNLSDADRARTIAVNMERLRWLDRNPGATRIDVNLAAARLSYWRDGKLVESRKVVVGEPEHETPQLESPIFRLVANPTWTVPRSIQEREIKGKGAAYLKRNNMTWKNGWIVQQPGPKNSLGLVKFDMKNEHAIYLHDTPAKALFAEVQRQRSHGCVRVDDALGFAELLAKDEGVTDAWHAARATGKETFVSIPHEIPVRMLYQTVLFDDAGAPVIRNDPYGWNDRIADALGFPKGSNFRMKAKQADVGP